MARIGKPGIALAMADTALRAIGLMALPAHNFKYVVYCATNSETVFFKNLIKVCTHKLQNGTYGYIKNKMMVISLWTPLDSVYQFYCLY